jgi:asparagine N-glycosylation enzyme membrane subunit Stt3
MSAPGVITDTMANIRTVKDASGKKYTYKLAVRTPEQKKEYVSRMKFKKFLESINEYEYHSYTNDNNYEVMYSAELIIQLLKSIHNGDELEDLGFSDPEEAKAFYKDWYLNQWLMMNDGDDRSKIRG